MEKQSYIYSLSGLKCICLLLLFWWHSTIPNLQSVDLGARTCEFLFVASGFLVGYNAFYKSVPDTWAESFRYTYKKILDFWPLHFFSMIAVMFVCYTPVFTKRNLVNAALNLSLLQAWSPYQNVRFSFNGASWFLSAILFCYFLSPMLLKFCKKIRTAGIFFVIVFAVRYGVEYIVTHCPGEFWMINIHTNPLIRSMEFFLGMLCVPVFMYIKNRLADTKKEFCVMSIIEVLTVIISVYCLIKMGSTVARSLYVAMMLIICFVFAFNGGIVSRILSLKIFRLFSQIQFEFFILHQAMMKCLNRPLGKLFPDWRIMNLVLFLMIVILAFAYKKFLKKKCSRLLDWVLNKGLQFMQIG